MEPKAQLRLVSRTNGGNTSGRESRESSITDDPTVQGTSETDEVSDILMTPRFVADEQNSELKSVHQALILAQCLSIEKNSRHDELQSMLTSFFPLSCLNLCLF